MKRTVFTLLCFAGVALFTQCKKDSGTADCSSLTDDQILIDGKAYSWETGMYHSCGQAPNSDGTTFGYGFVRDAKNGVGSTLNMPTIGFKFSIAPAPNTTKTYTADDGMWILSSTTPPDNRVKVTMNNYQGKYSLSEYWFSQSDAGTITVTTNSAGAVTINFSDLKLVRSGGQVTDKMALCAKNLVCH